MCGHVTRVETSLSVDKSEPKKQKRQQCKCNKVEVYQGAEDHGDTQISLTKKAVRATGLDDADNSRGHDCIVSESRAS
ncbi:hypothetical protein L484_020145 [Morus notabilis]|uniref:Uncharacterized protein n=1 Tax=Morus notabilis TaxID=981085 RepID=W9QN31_9ROSA|nr:hypothetical protein L484_020145 [Morus notabilis]